MKEKKIKIEFKNLFDLDIYDSFYGREEDLSHTKRVLARMEGGWYEMVSEYDKYQIEKKRIQK